MNHKRQFCLWINPSPGLTHTTCSCATQLCNPAPSQPSPTKVTESQQCSSHCMQDVQRKGNKTLSTSPGQSALCTRDGSALRTERELYLQLCVVCFASEHTTAGYDCREKAFLQQRLLLPAALRHSPELQGLERDRCSSSPCWDTCAAGRAPFCTHAPPNTLTSCTTHTLTFSSANQHRAVLPSRSPAQPYRCAAHHLKASRGSHTHCYCYTGLKGEARTCIPPQPPADFISPLRPSPHPHSTPISSHPC